MASSIWYGSKACAKRTNTAASVVRRQRTRLARADRCMQAIRSDTRASIQTFLAQAFGPCHLEKTYGNNAGTAPIPHCKKYARIHANIINYKVTVACNNKGCLRIMLQNWFFMSVALSAAALALTLSSTAACGHTAHCNNRLLIQFKLAKQDKYTSRYHS